MRAEEFDNPKNTFVEIFRKFLPLAMKIIGLNSLPKMVFEKEVESPEQPTFGQYVNNEHILYVGLANRHPNDILRTIAHELVHYKQDTEHKLNDMSGATGSPEENEANALAGIVMRNFNKRYPEYLKTKPIVSESWSEKYKRSINCSNPKGFSQRAHCQGRKKNEDVEENFDKEAGAWRDWQLKMLPRKMEMLSKLVKGWVPSEADHIAAIEAGYNAMRDTGDVKDAAKAISDTFNEIQHRQGMAENLINEAQTFDFDGEKQAIIQFINNVLNNKPNNRQYNPFYGVIVGNPKIGGASKLGLPDTFAASWKKYFQNPSFVGGSPEPWSQINIGDQFAKATGDDRTLNFYITVDKEKNNIIKFFNNLHKLGSYLQPISQQYQTPLKFKTHSLLDSFIGHNDSLKVYYYDPQVKDLVVNATRKWLSDSGITTGTRSHEHGVDVKSGGGSFGQILSNHIYDTFTKLIQTQGNKYTPEQYFEWLKQHLPSLIQQVKQKEVAENFADGRNPQDKGDSARHGIKKGMTIAQLKKIRSSDSASPRKKQLAHWQINMRQGRKK